MILWPMYSTSEPVFGKQDRVDGGGGGSDPPKGDDDELPEELKGKSPAEIARFFQERERILKSSYEDHLNQLENRDPPPKPEPKGDPPPKPTKQEWLSDPNKVVTDAIRAEAVSKEEFAALTASQQENFIHLAKTRARDELKDQIERGGGTFYWDRLGKELDALMEHVEPANKTKAETWKTAYQYAVGQNVNTLTKEAVTKATMPTEPISPGGNPPPAKKTLSPEEKKVAEGLGLSDESFLKAAQRMQDQEWPLTMDNRQRR